MKDPDLNYIVWINIKNKTKETFNIYMHKMCVTDNGDVYATELEKYSIVRLSPSDAVSIVLSTDPLEPVVI